VGLLETLGQLERALLVELLGEDLDVARPVEQLVLEREVAEQRLRERLRLLCAGLGEGDETADRGGDDVGDPTETAEVAGDGDSALLGVRGVLLQFTTDGVGPRLRDADLSGLRLRGGQLQQDAELGGELAGVGDSDGESSLRGWKVRCHLDARRVLAICSSSAQMVRNASHSHPRCNRFAPGQLRLWASPGSP
jgi:hypothetical protein